MKSADLLVLIQSDEQASALFAAGDDTGCAVRCSVIAPKVVRETRLSRLGVRSLYADPTVGQTVLATIDVVAQSNPIIADVRRFAEPGVHPSCLPDWGHPSIRSALIAPVEAGGLGLNAEQAAPILAASEYPQTITQDDVAAVRNAQ